MSETLDILVIAPHPDDAELGVVDLALRLVDVGDTVRARQRE